MLIDERLRQPAVDLLGSLLHVRVMRGRHETGSSVQWRRIGLTLFATLCLGIAVFLSARPYFERALLVETTRLAELFRSTLNQALSRFQHLPKILKDDPLIIGAFFGVGLRDTNRRLADIAERAGVDAVYLLNPDGLTIAASNHARAQSFLGQNYGFRPYFQEAMRGENGTFFAIGATTRRPGYFIADRVLDATTTTIGVVAVKIDLAPLTESWSRSGERVFVSNADGVIFLSSDDALRYRGLEDIEPRRRDEIAAERQFADETLALLDWREEGNNRASLDGTLYQHVHLKVGTDGWRLHFLSSLANVTERAWLVSVLAVLILAVLMVLTMSLRSARMRAALMSSHRDRRALIAANTELRKAQDELQRTSKLTALGQLAASVTHELGQPLSALRNYLTAAELKDQGNALIAPVGGIVTRMEGITRQLRFFASPASDPLAKVDLADIVVEAAALVRHDADAADATLRIEAKGPIFVRGDRLRLEQVLVNLLRNAVTALDGCARRDVTVVATQSATQAILSVTDTGPGLDGRSIAQLAEPFHTTRASGTGMGLGLAISAEIVREHSGEMIAKDATGGGAVFTITFPIWIQRHG